MLPGGESFAGDLEVLAGVASPELFLVDAVAAFDLPFCSGRRGRM
jgi:hypothetical protein